LLEEEFRPVATVLRTNRTKTGRDPKRLKKGELGLTDLLRELFDNFTVREEDRVRRYISANPELIPVLQEAPERIRQAFGQAAPLALETSIAPEGLPEHEELWIMVGCRPDVDEALRNLRLIDSSWLVNLPMHFRGKVNVDTEFI
jgi:hypothetical protein